jgi:hypothetical protein
MTAVFSVATDVRKAIELRRALISTNIDAVHVPGGVRFTLDKQSYPIARAIVRRIHGIDPMPGYTPDELAIAMSSRLSTKVAIDGRIAANKLLESLKR